MASLVRKEQPTLKKTLSTLDTLANNLNKKYGKVIMGRIGNNEAIKDKLTIRFIPTPCRALNEAIGGGFPRGRCTLVTGKPDSGKTSILLETIAKNMAKNPEFVAGWLESENSLELDYIVKTFGIDPERFFFMKYDSKLGAEVMLDIVQNIISSEDVRMDMFCINSLKCLVPTKEVEASLSDALVALQARMNARLTRKFTALVSENDTAFVMVCHLGTDIGSKSNDPLIITGGHAIKYWSSLTMDLRKHAIMAGELINKEEGIKVCVTIKKNHCLPAINPYRKVEYYAIFGEGIEQILSNLEDAIAAGIIEKRGNWLYWMKDGKQYEKFSGKNAFRTFMKDNPDKWEEFNSMLKGCGVKSLTADEIDEIKAEEKLIDENIVYDDSEEDKLIDTINKESA